MYGSPFPASLVVASRVAFAGACGSLALNRCELPMRASAEHKSKLLWTRGIRSRYHLRVDSQRRWALAARGTRPSPAAGRVDAAIHESKAVGE